MDSRIRVSVWIFVFTVWLVLTMFSLICSDVEARTLELENQVRQLKQLFKPWPPPTKHEEEKSAVKVEETAPCPEEVIPQEEQAELDRIEKLLNKAQIARNAHKKITKELQKETKKETEHPQISHEDIVDLNSNTENDKKTDDSSEETSQINEINKKATKKNPSQNTTSKKESSLSAVSKQKITGSVINTRRLSENFSTVSKSAVNNTERMKQIVMEKNASFQTRRPESSSGKRKVVPAHISAPFQTNPNLPTSRLQTTYRSATSAKTLRGKSSASSTRGRQVGVKNSGREPLTTHVNPGSTGRKADKSINSSNKVNKTELNKGVDEQLINDRLKEIHTSAEDEMVKNEDHEYYDDSIAKRTRNNRVQETVIENQTVINKNSGILKDADNMTNTDQGAEKLFDLKRDGSTLEVPVKLRKYVSHNSKLRRKYQTQTLTRKVDSPSAAQHFSVLLEHSGKFVDNAKIQSLVKLTEKLTSTYKHLCDVLESLHLGQITDNASAQELLHGKTHLEFILTEFQEAEELFLKTDFRLLRSVPATNKLLQLVNQKTLGSPVIWYNKFSGIPGHRSADKVIYNSYRDLERYRSLVFQNQLLSAQLHIMDSSADLILPVLKSLDPSSSEFHSVLRCAYELLLTTSNSSPVIVKDTIEEEL